MNNNAYLEKLKDPRWQKKRLEVLSRDEWTCQACGATDKSLQVDHLKYAPSGRPWEVENEDLQTLCEGCHQEVTKLRRSAREGIPRADGQALARIVGYLDYCDCFTLDHDQRLDGWHAFGVAHAIGLPDSAVFALMDTTGGITIERLQQVARQLRRAGLDQLIKRIVDALDVREPKPV